MDRMKDTLDKMAKRAQTSPTSRRTSIARTTSRGATKAPVPAIPSIPTIPPRPEKRPSQSLQPRTSQPKPVTPAPTSKAPRPERQRALGNAESRSATPPAAPRARVTPDVRSFASQPSADTLDMDRVLDMPRRPEAPSPTTPARRASRASQTRPLNPDTSVRPLSHADLGGPHPHAASYGPALSSIGDPRLYMSDESHMRSRPKALRSSSGMESLGDGLKEYMAALARKRRIQALSSGGGNTDSGDPKPATPKAENLCPHCGGAGYLRRDVPVSDPNFGQPIPCSCKEREMEERRRREDAQHRTELENFYNSSLMPFSDKTFATFNPSLPGMREPYEVAYAFAESFTDPAPGAPSPGWLLLMGGVGTGKTHLAAAIAQECLATGRSVYFAVVTELLDHLRSAFAPTSDITYDKLFDQIRAVDLLVLDDLGAENGTAWAIEKLFQLINHRYNLRIPMVITTNNDLHAHMDSRIRSRLSDASLVRMVNIKAQDHRPRNTKRAPRW